MPLRRVLPLPAARVIAQPIERCRVTGTTRTSGHPGSVLNTTGRYNAQLDGTDARLVGQLALVLAALPDAVERDQRTSGTGRSGEDPAHGEPLRTDIVDYQTQTRAALAALVRDGRRHLGWSSPIEPLSSAYGYTCPECDQLTLLLDRETWVVRCTASDCGVSWAVSDTQIADMLAEQAHQQEVPA